MPETINLYYNDFAKWVEKYLTRNIPEQVVAYNFNLYEDEKTFHVQLIGLSRFSSEDQDWACDEIVSTGEDVFIVEKNAVGYEWQEGQKFGKQLVLQYLKNGTFGYILKKAIGVGIGFVDGDIEVIYVNIQN